MYSKTVVLEVPKKESLRLKGHYQDSEWGIKVYPATETKDFIILECIVRTLIESDLEKIELKLVPVDSAIGFNVEVSLNDEVTPVELIVLPSVDPTISKASHVLDEVMIKALHIPFETKEWIVRNKLMGLPLSFIMKHNDGVNFHLATIAASYTRLLIEADKWFSVEKTAIKGGGWHIEFVDEENIKVLEKETNFNNELTFIKDFLSGEWIRTCFLDSHITVMNSDGAGSIFYKDQIGRVSHIEDSDGTKVKLTRDDLGNVASMSVYKMWPGQTEWLFHSEKNHTHEFYDNGQLKKVLTDGVVTAEYPKIEDISSVDL